MTVLKDTKITVPPYQRISEEDILIPMVSTNQLVKSLLQRIFPDCFVSNINDSSEEVQNIFDLKVFELEQQPSGEKVTELFHHIVVLVVNSQCHSL